jgi:hypothetical protein
MDKDNPYNLTHIRIIVLILLFTALSLLLTGCVTFNDPEVSQEYTSDTVGTLDSNSVIGQSFIARRPRLNGVMIWFTTPPEQGKVRTNGGLNSIIVELFYSPLDATPIFTTTLPISPSLNNSLFTIQFPILDSSDGDSYYLQLSTASNSIQINGRNEDAYPNGQAFINGKAINADLAFRVSYDYDIAAFIQDMEQVISNIWLVFPLLIVLWLPGWLLLDFSGINRQFNFGEQSALSIGISLALFPVLMLWTTILKFEWTRSGLLFLSGFLVALLLVRLSYKFFISRKTHRNQDNNFSSETQTHQPARNYLLFTPSLALIGIFIISLVLRLVMIRDLATPAWVDSVHHALLTRLILSNGSYPSTYLPYLNIPPTNYHLGFHSITAAFTWLSNLRIDQSLLILGQVLNALTVFSVYLFTKALTRSSSAGLIAAVITGFLTPMPAYYTSWGRYTELTGLIILPVAFVFIQLLEMKNTPWRRNWIIFLCAITLAGLFMVHYRVTIFLVGLILAYLIIYTLIKKTDSSRNPIPVLLLVLFTAIVSVCLVSPWLYPTLKSIVLPLLNTSGSNSVPYFQDFSWAYLTSALGKQTLVLAGLGLVWGMIKGKRFTYLLFLWILILFLIANLGALRLPGGSLVNTSSVEIMLFIPISVLGGYFFDQILISWKRFLPKQVEMPFLVITTIIIGLAALIGARQLVTIINPITILSRSEDLPAIEWIGENVPEGETIVINPFAWGYGIYAGSDGGYWISPLSGMATIPPPVLYGLGDDINTINEQSQNILKLGANPLALSEYLRTNQLHYIFIGAKGGVISPEDLSSNDLFTILYHQNGVWIFGLKP